MSLEGGGQDQTIPAAKKRDSDSWNYSIYRETIYTSIQKKVPIEDSEAHSQVGMERTVNSDSMFLIFPVLNSVLHVSAAICN